MNIIEKIANGLSLKVNQVSAAVDLLDEGATVPFISRYRKEATQNLSDTDLRNVVEQLTYLRELKDRQETILKSIAEQEKLTPELEKLILAADNKARLEDLYLPFKPKRRTKAQIAREAGLEPLAMQLWETPDLLPTEIASQYINEEKEVKDSDAALEGARQILMEVWAENPELTQLLREFIWENGIITSVVSEGKEEEGQKFSDYFEYKEAIKQIPSHRALAVFRGRKEKILKVSLDIPETKKNLPEETIASYFNIKHEQRPADAWLLETVHWTWQIKLFTRLELDLLNRLRESAELQAIHVFANNLKDLLMASPAGAKVTMGLDPGFRTGVKLAIIDSTGKLLAYKTIFPHPPKKDWDASLVTLANLCRDYKVQLLSIGNGTASRETDKLASDLIKANKDLDLTKIVVSEAGASVYSASKTGAEEFPDLDVTYRGAVSIARRLQDPLAELVKIDPKSIGVGQYQHDVSQTQLARNLDAVVEDCVNAVGVDVNTASIPLLGRVSGLNEAIANQIVQYRDTHGAFTSREFLKKVPRLGDKTFEQAAGFLRIMNGENPLDASAVHPEAYPVVQNILHKMNATINGIMGNTSLLKALNASEYTNDQFGLPTVVDIIKELEKPGRDPRPEFKMAIFKEGVEKISDLKVGMELQGVITNVTHFGAFVDIGVHQDGLVHKSQLANRFINDPREIVRVGDIVEVTVVEVDASRKRISLTMVKIKNEVKEPKKKKMVDVTRDNDSLLALALGKALRGD
ncbi:MAG: RNA-binding transcriptional accessory protein [Gammaproteobacteria bacterium]|nr:RNA-binding transcriptional accessory protein [Gammaproteobacteria bacterium]